MSSELPSGERPNVNRALSWAFDSFKRNPVPFLALAAVVAVIQMFQQLALTPLQNAVTACLDVQSPGQEAACANALGGGLTTGLLLTIVFMIVAFLATIGVFRAALAVSCGEPPPAEDPSLFDTWIDWFRGDKDKQPSPTQDGAGAGRP